MNHGGVDFRRAFAPPAAIGPLAWLLIATAATAAPVLSTDENAATGSLDASAATARAATPAASQSMGVTGLPEASTGNKNLDLLLELQGRPDVEAQRPRSAASAAAAAAAASALAELRAKAAQRPVPESGVDRPPAQPFDGVGMLGREERTSQPPERREWVGGPGNAGGQGGFGGGAGYDPVRSSGDGDKLLQGPLREAILFLRENRYWVLGGLAALAAVGAALKAYSRRV